ncbi:class F sortase [Alkalicoccus daliensis]|uniref:LPXTG-site transpeptidase (Sortase) family protein n=1 Tax=Alkalicoccus daliensis TaxID=745820 RepID=A0A1H0IU54_9BACI|nr:class F sortase [Alkalicoccus daliensis]SDO34987.1 LPXTG-site transpeptidase (sortase) family protein [Alkalicoccus daliensis]
MLVCWELQYSFARDFLFKGNVIFSGILLLFLSACGVDQYSSENSSTAYEETEVLDESYTEMIEVESQKERSEVNSTEETNPAEEAAADSVPIVPVKDETGIIPAHLEIPSIKVDAQVDGYGLDEDGKMEVPDEGESIAWFERGAKPGTQGNAVLAGHVDDRTGPAVFYDLNKLEEGDEIIVTSEDGEAYTFLVSHKEAYPYDDAPIDVVFGKTSSRNLNLITCTGEFDTNAGTHRERLVVFTELKE